MIGYLRGTVSHLLIDYCFVDVRGVGYRVFISAATRVKLTLGQEAMLLTYLNVREDAMILYGFYTQAEYDLFLQLISVAGIGPKGALGILSAIAADQLCKSIQQKNVAALTKLPGIGKKTAERLILELHDKMSLAATEDGTALPSEELNGASELMTEAGQALISLGYTQAEFAPALRRAGGLKTVEEVIKFALKEFARRS